MSAAAPAADAAGGTRPARPGDTAAIAALAAEWGYRISVESCAERLDALCASPVHAVFVAPNVDAAPDDTSDSSLDGWLVIEARLTIGRGAFAEIAGLVVAGRARRGGIGRRLVAAGERWALARGLRTVSVQSSVLRDEAHRFYPALGYSRAKTQHVYTRTLP
ncbi:MAG: GNAT family N-acetyltransferase [Lysobacteraceae bacterium]